MSLSNDCRDAAPTGERIIIEWPIQNMATMQNKQLDLRRIGEPTPLFGAVLLDLCQARPLSMFTEFDSNAIGTDLEFEAIDDGSDHLTHGAFVVDAIPPKLTWDY